MRTLLHTSDPANPLVDLGVLDAAARLGDVVPAADELLFLEDNPDPLDPTCSIRELVAVEQVEVLHLHRSRHRRVEVDVRYDGRRVEDRYAPSATLRRVERRAVRELGIADADAADLVLRRRGSEADLDPEDHVGTLAGPHGHPVALDLVPAHRFAG